RCSFLRAAAILHPHADVVPHRTDGPRLRLARLDAVALERPDDLVGVEILEAHAEVVDARLARGRAGAPAAAAREHEDLDGRSDRQRRRGRSLIRADAEAEQLIVGVVSARRVAGATGSLAVAHEGDEDFL